MKRYFLIVFLCFAVLNFCYKCFVYLNSEKADGKVIGNELITTKHQSKNGRSSYEESISPVVAYKYQGIAYENSRSKWGFGPSYELNEAVTVLIPGNGKEIEINGFFQFWFTLGDMLLAFCVCLVGTVVLGNILPEKKEKIREWK